ncbi:MAG TPA: stalk domain-containing protein [Syntrophomonadaceae bacterium]|nr:stalk domain-containing protein [Syntrophomonadaceae bacterium]
MSKMKKVRIGVILSLLISVFVCSSVLADTPLKLIVNGHATYPDYQIIEGRTLLSIHTVGNAIGITDANIVWDDANQTVTLKKGSTVVQIIIGSTQLLNNGNVTIMDVAPQILNDRTMLPVGAIARAFGYTVSWDEPNNAVILSSSTESGHTAKSSSAKSGYEVGNAMPDFTVSTIDGGSATLSDYQGKPVFINIFATWCSPCMQEMPDIQKLYSKYGDSVVFLTIDLQEDKNTASEFAKHYSYTMPIGYADSLGSFNIEYIPDTFILDENGIIKYAYVGSQNYDTFSNAIDALRNKM